MTPSGTYFADGIQASDFVSCNIPRRTWNIWRKYAHFRYSIGMPMYGYVIDGYKLGRCEIDINWFAHSMQYLTGVDAWAMDSSPLLIHLALLAALFGEMIDATIRMIKMYNGYTLFTLLKNFSMFTVAYMTSVKSKRTE